VQSTRPDGRHVHGTARVRQWAHLPPTEPTPQPPVPPPPPGPEIIPPIDDPPLPGQNPVPVREPPVMPTPMGRRCIH